MVSDAAKVGIVLLLFGGASAAIIYLARPKPAPQAPGSEPPPGTAIPGIDDLTGTLPPGDIGGEGGPPGSCAPPS